MRERLYLVTGAMGHLGNTIIQQLVQKNCRVRGLALPGDHAVSFSAPQVEIVRGDVREPESLKPFFANPEQYELAVIHTAGIVSITSKYQQKVYDVNVTGTKHILSLCKEHRVKKLVHVSSVHAIPEKSGGQQLAEVSRFDPEEVRGLYAKTKAEASQLVLDAASQGLDASIVHPSGIIGPGDWGHGHLTQMIIDYLDGRLVACVNGGYDFVDVRDVAAGTISCVENGRRGECYILSNRFCTVREVLKMLHDITGKKEIKVILPTWLAKATAPLAERYYKMLKQPPLYTAYSLYTLTANSNFTHQKASQQLGYAPRPLRQTLADTAQWLLEHRRLKSCPDWRTKTAL